MLTSSLSSIMLDWWHGYLIRCHGFIFQGSFMKSRILNARVKILDKISSRSRTETRSIAWMLWMLKVGLLTVTMSPPTADFSSNPTPLKSDWCNSDCLWAFFWRPYAAITSILAVQVSLLAPRPWGSVFLDSNTLHKTV